MSDSFFQKIYKFKQSETKNSQENFLTEIFAYCLKNDEVFRKSFFVNINLFEYNDSQIKESIKTQYITKTKGRPDICLKDDNNLIFIENKIDSLQGENQLKNYKNDLLSIENNKIKNKSLIFITKHYEETNISKELNFNFIYLRWFDVYELIQKPTNEITKELALYLEKEKMSKKLDFKKEHESFFRNFEEVFYIIKDFFKLVKDDSDISNTFNLKKFNDYILQKWEFSIGIETNLQYGKLWIGFWLNGNEMNLAVHLYNLNEIEKENVLKKYNNLSKEWKNDDDKDIYKFTKFSNLIKNKGNFLTHKALEFIKECLTELNENNLLK